MTDKEKLTEIQDGLLEASKFICDMTLLFTAPHYSDIHPEMSGIFSAAEQIESLANQLSPVTKEKEESE